MRQRRHNGYFARIRRRDHGERKRFPQVAIEQMHVGRKRERWRVVPEPPLHRHRASALGAQQQGVGCRASIAGLSAAPISERT